MVAVGEDLSQTLRNHVVQWCDSPHLALTIEYFVSRYSCPLLENLRNRCWICGGQSSVVAVDFQRAVVSLPTIIPPILPLQGFSVRGWIYIMGMAIDTEFMSVNILIFYKRLILLHFLCRRFLYYVRKKFRF
jgi:hypothetical protein